MKQELLTMTHQWESIMQLKLSKMKEYLIDSIKLNNIKFLLEEFELGGIDVLTLIKKIELIIKTK